MTDLDLDAIRERVNTAYYEQQGPAGGWAGHYHDDATALIDRIKSLEARLARVTDDNMAERLADSLGGSDEFTPAEHLDPHGELRALAGAALAAIRSVAADEQDPNPEEENATQQALIERITEIYQSGIEAGDFGNLYTDPDNTLDQIWDALNGIPKTGDH